MLATQIEVSDGTLTILNVGIEFFEQSDISVSLDLSDPLVVGVDYNWSTATTIQFLNTANTPGGFVPNGVEVLLRRDTQNEEMYNIYDGGAPFSRLTLDENYKQLLFLSQEFSEGLGLDGLRDNLDMGGYRITNLGLPTFSTDAANKLYVDTGLGKTVRTPEAIPSLPPAATRANHILGFDASGNPYPLLPVDGSGAALALDLANTLDPFLGVTMVGGSLRIVDNIAALRDLPVGGSTRVFVYSYTTLGDGGGGQYYLDEADLSSADNGGTIIVADDGGRWKYVGVPTVHTFGAKGDGVTSDIAAFEASILATGGYARMLAKSYMLQGWFFNTERAYMLGAGKGTATADLSAITGGTILLGHWHITCVYGKCRDFGSDCGPDLGLAVTIGGFVMSAPTGGIGIDLDIQDVYILSSSNTGPNAVHAGLFEGWDKAYIKNVDVANAYVGIVYKGRNAMISGIRGHLMGLNTVFVKSDIPMWAGNVADATVVNVTVYDVRSQCAVDNLECNHVYVYASTAILTNVQVHMVTALYGNSIVTVGGGVAPVYTTNVRVSGLVGAGCDIGFETAGLNYDVSLVGMTITNPFSGQAWVTGGNTSNWMVSDVVLVLTTPNAGVYACTTGGTGCWNNFTLRSGIGTKQIPWDPANVVVGVRAGPLVIDGEGLVVVGSNWTATVGDEPRLNIAPGNLVTLHGQIENIVATGNTLLVLPGRDVIRKFVVYSLTSGSATPVSLGIDNNLATLHAPVSAVGMIINFSGVTYAA